MWDAKLDGEDEVAYAMVPTNETLLVWNLIQTRLASHLTFLCC